MITKATPRNILLANVVLLILINVGQPFAQTPNPSPTPSMTKAQAAIKKKADALYSEGTELFNKGKAPWTKAEEKLNEAYQRSISIDDKKAAAGSLIFLGAISSLNGQHEKALEQLGKALEFKRQVGDKQGEAIALLTIGEAYRRSGDKQKALEYYGQSLPLRQEAGDKKGVALTLKTFGQVYREMGEPKKALEYYNKAVEVYKEIGDKGNLAWVLNIIGSVYADMGEWEKAIDNFNQAVPLMKEVGDKDGEAQSFENLGNISYWHGEPERSVGYYTQALPLRQGLTDKQAVSRIFNSLGMAYRDLSENQKALESFNQALNLRKELGDVLVQAVILNRISMTYAALGQPNLELEYCIKSLELYKQIGDKSGQAFELYQIGIFYSRRGEYQKALEALNQVLPLAKETGNKSQESETLSDIGYVYANLGERQKALEYYKQALALGREAGNVVREVQTLNSIGSFFEEGGERQKALDYYNESLQISRKGGYTTLEAETLKRIGIIYYNLEDLKRALEFLEQAVVLQQKVGVTADEIVALNIVGLIQSDLGAKQKALDTFDRVLQLSRKKGYKGWEALTLNNIGWVYEDRNEHQRALDVLNQALAIYRQIGEKIEVARTLNYLAMVYQELKEKEKALDYLNQALSLNRQIGDKSGEAKQLNSIGWFYMDIGEKQKALDYYNQALPLMSRTGNRSGEADVLENIGNVWESQNNSRFAIFYYKQSVNKYQELRQAIAGFEKETQKAYLKSIENPYRQLADALVEEGRLFEAEQVLGLLKDDENFQYVRRDSTEADKLLQRVDLRDDERNALERYKTFGDKLGELGAEFGKLQELRNKGAVLSPEQENRFKQLEKDLENASTAFQVFLRSLQEEFSKKPTVSNEIDENRGLQADLKSYGEGVVALYTLVGEDRYRVILTTPDVQIDGKTEIKSTDLNKKIGEFVTQLQNPGIDPRPLGKELYDIIVKPIEGQLSGARAKTILWSLDGSLRYVPLAALWDGKQYFGQKYQNVIISLASRTRLGDSSIAGGKVLGLGVSLGKEVIEADNQRRTFSALPSVKNELESIVQENSAEKGVLPGTRFLNEKFTEDAVKQNLGRGFKVVHIATHFKLGLNDVTSYLLLGDGHTLSVEQIRKSPSLRFTGADLVTLSACNTSRGINGDGREIEGLSYVIQQNGGKSVIATLWPVNDESTGFMMAEFYRLWRQGGGMTKAEAIQKAQKEMIEGKIKPSGKGGGCRSELIAPTGGKVPFKCDANAPFSHPYFWSPFVLIGNWK